LRALVPALLLIGLIACRADEPRDAELLREFAKQGCNHRLVVVYTRPDGMPNEKACALATAAFAYIGSGGARLINVLPADTARLRPVVLSEFDIESMDGDPIDHYWLVEFTRPNHSASVAVRIDRVTGKFTAGLREPMPDAVTSRGPDRS